MSNTLLLTISQKQTDDEGDVSNESIYLLSQSFSYSTKQSFSMLSGNSYLPIAFGQVTTASAVKITTDETIVIKIDGTDQEFTITNSIIWLAEMTALSIKNNSGDIANVEVEIYGE